MGIAKITRKRSSSISKTSLSFLGLKSVTFVFPGTESPTPKSPAFITGIRIPDFCNGSYSLVTIRAIS